jgi:hypothetical protein
MILDSLPINARSHTCTTWAWNDEPHAPATHGEFTKMTAPLTEYLQDLAVSRANDAEVPGQAMDAAGCAQGDAAWLDTLASELEAASHPSPIAKKS